MCGLAGLLLKAAVAVKGSLCEGPFVSEDPTEFFVLPLGSEDTAAPFLIRGVSWLEDGRVAAPVGDNIVVAAGRSVVCSTGFQH